MNDDTLRAIDRALTQDLELDDVAPGSVEELALLLRAEAPRPSGGFVDRLDRRIEQEFVHPEPTVNGRVRRMFRWHPWIGGSLAAAVSTVLLVLFVATPAKQSGSSKDAARGDDPLALQADDYEAVPLAGGGGGHAGRSTGGGGGGASTVAASATVTDYRRYVLGSGLFLEVEPREVPEVVAEAVAVADELGGFAGSSTYDVEADEASGSVDLWVPAGEHAEAIARLSGLGEVTRILEDREDRTASRDDLVRQIAEDRELVRRATEGGPCGSDDRFCRQQVAAIASQLELREQRLANLDRRIDLSLINVKVEGVDRPGPSPARWSIEWAVDRAGELVERAAAVAILATAILVVPLLLGTAFVVGLRRTRRRRRERTLDEG